jgi:pimeloyl-ACP methyl ester carboxylesterase
MAYSARWTAGKEEEMATILIVHGAWGGGWEWTPVADELRELGHDVFVPTLTGLGERSHLGDDVALSDHLEDVLSVVAFERLRDVVMCGHSYGGMVATAAADRVPESVRGLVYLDGMVPRDGQAVVDLFPPEFGDGLVAAAEGRGDGRVPYPPEVAPPEGLIPEAVRAAYVERTRPQPLATLTEPVRLDGLVSKLPRAYVRCVGDTDADAGLMETFAERARAEGWLYRESATPHDLHLFDPRGTAVILDDLAGSLR